MMDLHNLFGDSGGGADYHKAKMPGVMLAVVTNNKDPESLGRVKLKLPIREIEQETDWARVTTFMGGKSRGSLFVPEVGDEVLVAFLMGDPNQPYVIGSLWNKNDPAPKGDDKNNLRKIVSRAGHEILFDDTDKDEKIVVKTKKGHTLSISDKADEVKLADQSGAHSLVIKGGSSGSITVKSSNTKVEITAQGDITLTSNKAIKVKSTQISLEAQATMAIKAGATLDLKSDGIINIKGSMVKIN